MGSAREVDGAADPAPREGEEDDGASSRAPVVPRPAADEDSIFGSVVAADVDSGVAAAAYGSSLRAAAAALSRRAGRRREPSRDGRKRRTSSRPSRGDAAAADDDGLTTTSGWKESMESASASVARRGDGASTWDFERGWVRPDGSVDDGCYGAGGSAGFPASARAEQLSPSSVADVDGSPSVPAAGEVESVAEEDLDNAFVNDSSSYDGDGAEASAKDGIDLPSLIAEVESAGSDKENWSQDASSQEAPAAKAKRSLGRFIELSPRAANNDSDAAVNLSETKSASNTPIQ